ncbi:hypothetical protein, partial [Actinomadura sp. RB99]|uniref:hypothetical protein n=1 Tax=Actinomadura sp. RB99 TaxID=2691577 RepID=UPI0019D62102
MSTTDHITRIRDLARADQEARQAAECARAELEMAIVAADADGAPESEILAAAPAISGAATTLMESHRVARGVRTILGNVVLEIDCWTQLGAVDVTISIESAPSV